MILAHDSAYAVPSFYSLKVLSQYKRISNFEFSSNRFPVIFTFFQSQ